MTVQSQSKLAICMPDHSKKTGNLFKVDAGIMTQLS